MDQSYIQTFKDIAAKIESGSLPPMEALNIKLFTAMWVDEHILDNKGRTVKALIKLAGKQLNGE
jgi:hypothetical protein